MNNVLNIPISLICRQKATKSSVEMLACAVMIKYKYQNSTLYNVSLKTIKSEFNVAHRRAKRLMENLIKSDLFVYDKKRKTLFAKSFKSKEKVMYKKHEAYADYCKKMNIKPLKLKWDEESIEKVRLNDIVRELRDSLIECTIDSLEKGNFKNVGVNQVSSVETLNSKAMTQKRLAGISGMSRSTACRHLQKMIEDGRVGKTQIVAECVIPHLNADTERAWMARHPGKKFFAWHNLETGEWSGWQHHGTVYTILQRRISDSFRHVIYNYRRKNTIEPSTSAEIDGKWDE